MSQEDVEFVRNLYAMIDRGDAEAWDLLPRDFVIDLSRRLIDPVILRGPDEMRAFYRDLGEPWAGGAKLEVEELIDAGHQVLVLMPSACPNCDLDREQIEWMKLPDGHQALLVNGGGIDGGSGAFFANAGQDVHAVGSSQPLASASAAS